MEIMLSDNIRAKAGTHKPGSIAFRTGAHRWTVELMPPESDIYNKTILSPKETSAMLALGVALKKIVRKNAGYGNDFKVKVRGRGWHKVTFQNNRRTTLPAMVHGRVLRNGQVKLGKVSDYRVNRKK